jgi:hypothetical protein
VEDVVLVTPAVVVKPIDDEVVKARTTRTDDVLPPKRSVVSIADGMVIFILTIDNDISGEFFSARGRIPLFNLRQL